MLSFNTYIEEGIGGRILATGAGLIGGPLGSLSSIYDIEKEKQARQELARLQGKPIDQSNTPGVGQYALYGVGGFAPGLVGAISTNLAYSNRLQAEKELEDYKNQNNIQTPSPQNQPLNKFGKTIGTAGAVMGGLGALVVGNHLFQRYQHQKYINDMNKSWTDDQTNNNI